MTTNDDISSATAAAKLDLLQRIVASPTPAGAKDLAEAFAWLVSPAQSHAGSARS